MADLRHQNNGKCEKCKEIMDKFPNMNKDLRGWFIMFQAKHKEAHISCAGRGFQDQEDARAAGKSRAHYGQSSHNYNCAIDLFVIMPGKDIYDLKWFKETLAPEIPYFLNWYGAPGAAFHELPHLELRSWRGLIAQGLAELVEPDPKNTEVA